MMENGVIYNDLDNAKSKLKKALFQKELQILSETDYYVLRHLEQTDLYYINTMTHKEYLELLERRETIRITADMIRKQIDDAKNVNELYIINVDLEKLCQQLF